METVNAVVLGALAAAVLVPLAREYAEFRNGWGLGRLGALLTTALVLPALAVGIAVSLPLASTPGAQWTAAVVVTVVLYSLATRAVDAATDPARPLARR